MLDKSPLPFDLAFVPPCTPSFAELVEQLDATTDLSSTRRRDMISGLRRVADALGRPMNEVPSDGRWLQPRLARVSPVILNMSPKTWQNTVSNARSAMAHCGIVERRFRRIEDLNDDWRSLWQTVLELNDPTLPTALLRFVHFLNHVRVAPDDVRDTHTRDYREAVMLNEISKDPETAYRAAVNGWNLARQRVPGWPDIVLTLPSRQKKIALPLDHFPQSFIADLDALMQRLSAPDPLSDDDIRVLRPATLFQYRRDILRFASELCHAGMDSTSITKLADLITPENAERGLRQMLARNDQKTSRGISQVAALLRNLARMLKAPKATQDRLKKLAGKLAVQQPQGMTAKNRERLRLLQDETHQHRLLMLPESVFSRPFGDEKRYSILLAREDALAIAILIVCPLRVKSLAGLELDRHIQRPGDGRVFLVLEEADTKTGRSLEFELPRDVVKLMDKHLATRSPLLCPSGTQFLFPKRSGAQPIDPNALSTRIAKRVRKETGLVMNTHLFRHFAVMLWLDANPGGYEVARRLLGHSDLSHTINMYSGLEITTATRAFSDLISEKRRGR